jgi:hypothetical protein
MAGYDGMAVKLFSGAVLKDTICSLYDLPMNRTPPPAMSEEEFNAKLAKNVAESGAYMKTLEEARRSTAGLRESNDAVEDLRRLREVLMGHVDRTDRQARSLLRLDEYEAADHSIDPAMKCIKLARAVRLSIVLQQELLGLRPVPGARLPAVKDATAEKPAAAAPERELRDTETADTETRETDREQLHDRDDTHDYDDRSYDEVIDAIRTEFEIPAGVPVAAKAPRKPGGGKPKIRTEILASASAPPAFRLEHGPP